MSRYPTSVTSSSSPVSPRFPTVRTADMIAVIERGRLRELGSHVELVAAGGRHAENQSPPDRVECNLMIRG